MAQIVYQATAAGGTLDASSLAAPNYAVMRGSTGNDTLIGSSSNDRLDAGIGHNVMIGGDGDDQFFTNVTVTRSDTIDGGNGHDTLTITMNSSQLATTAMHDALVALNTFETYTAPANSTAHFVNATLGLDMTSVEVAQVRVDGVVKTLDAVGAHAVAPVPPASPIDFEDLAPSGTDLVPLPTGYHGFDWTSPNGNAAYSIAGLHEFNSGPLSASGNVAIATDGNAEYPFVVTRHGGGDFQFTQADVAVLASTGDLAGTLDVTFTGTKAGSTVGTVTVHADETHWQTVTVGWGAIDTLTLTWNLNSNVAALDNIWLS